MSTVIYKDLSLSQRRQPATRRIAVDVMVVTLGAIIASAGFFHQEITWLLAGV